MSKGYAVLLDSVIALSFAMVIMVSLVGISHAGDSLSQMTVKRLHFISEDALDVLNKQGILDDVGEQWAAADGNTSSPHFINASNMSTQYLESIMPPNVGYLLTIDDDVIANNSAISSSSAETLTHSTRLLVGYGKGLPTRGNVARAYLTRIKEKETSSYAYFGGYVGQGNLTLYIRDIPSDATVRRCCLELNIPASFDFYINDKPSGSFNPSGAVDMSANLKEGDVGEGNGCVESEYLSNVNPGFDNKFEIMFTEGNISQHYVGGGFIHVLYNTSEMDTDESIKTSRYYFPGIDGIINLYDSFYVPGTLLSMSMDLTFTSNYSTYFNIGDKNVFNTSGSGSSQNIQYSAEEMQAMGFIYSPVEDPKSLSQNTVPLRMGSGNMSEVVESGNADVILITDVSGSMLQCVDSNEECSSPNRRIDLAKQLDMEFVSMVLNRSGNRVAVVSFNSDISSSTSLTTSQSLLNSTIQAYSADGGTCICCAINQAYNILNTQGDPSKEKYIIVMSDGIPSHKCTSSGCSGTATTGSFESDCYGCTYCCDANPVYGSGCVSPTGSASCGYCTYYGYQPWSCTPAYGYTYTNGYCCYTNYCTLSCKCQCEIQNANYSSARANQNLDATVHSIGFGPVANCPMGNATLRAIAQSGNGTYCASDDEDDLRNCYISFADTIFSSSVRSQTIYYGGNLQNMVLDPASYIEFTYIPLNQTEYGQVSITRQTSTFDDTVYCRGGLDVPDGIVVSSAKVTSYSGSHWTDYVSVTNEAGTEGVYALGDWMSGTYLLLGDPYAVDIPAQNIQSGYNNTIYVRTGDNSSSQSGCSPDNRVIYTMRLNTLVGYGNVFTKNDGCNWEIEFEDGSIAEIPVPSIYLGNNTCTYLGGDISYVEDDASADAVYRLLSQLDLDEPKDGEVDLLFDEDMINLEMSQAGGVQSLWGPAKFKLIVWM